MLRLIHSETALRAARTHELLRIARGMPVPIEADARALAIDMRMTDQYVRQ